MKRVLLVCTLAVVLAAAFACAGAGPLTEQDKAAIRKVHDDYARAWNAEKPDVAAMVKASYAPDGQVLAPNVPAATGIEEITKALTSGPPIRDFRFRDVVIDGLGDLAVARGAYEGNWTTPSGALAHEQGKFVDMLKKQGDGSWKVVYDIWNADARPAALPVSTGELKPDASAEMRKLGYFIGTWQLDLDLEDSPFGARARATLVQDCRWFATGQQMICTTQGAMPTGPYHDMLVVAYDNEARAYKGYDMDSSGMLPLALAFKDNTWTWNYEFKMAGKPAKLRTTAFDLAKDGCSVKQELSTGGAWTVIAEGKTHRIAG